MTILVVDDLATDRKLCRTLLESEGHTVVEAADGLEALKLLETLQPDVIISDVLMPRMDGFRFCFEVRGRKRWQRIPFIFCTSTYTSPADQQTAFDLGANQFIHKPASAAAIQRAVEEALKQSKAYTPPTNAALSQAGSDLKEYSEGLVAKLERKNMELVALNTELAATRNQLQHLLAHSPVVLYMLKPENGGYVPVLITENIFRLLGFTVEEAMSPAWLQSQIHPEDLPLAMEANTTVFAHGEARLRYRIRARDKAYRWIHDYRRQVQDPAAQCVLISGAWHDVTQQKLAEDAMLELQEKFRHVQKLEGVGQLAGGVAHDFNNVLTVIQGHASMLELTQDLGSEALDSIKEIHLASQRAANLTRKLLLFSRKEVLQPRHLDLNQVVTEMTKMLRRMIGEQVLLQSELWNQPLFLKADNGMLEQVLMNLAVNARDAMPEGGRLTIRTSLHEVKTVGEHEHAEARPGVFARLEVSDTGCGIPPENLRRIFEPFFTTKGPGQGTGLGLATVYGIVKQHAGWVEVRSEPDKGATFEILLPLAVETAEPKTNPEPSTFVPHGHETILVVEDETAVRQLARRILTSHGYKVLEAATGADALEVWRKQRDQIKLVLTDMVMPGGMSGRDLAKRLLAERPDLKILYSSGYNPETTGTDFVPREGVNYLRKPYSVESLLGLVRDALRQSV